MRWSVAILAQVLDQVKSGIAYKPSFSVHPRLSLPVWEATIAITSQLFGPYLARRRWEHLAFRLIHEDLVAVNQAAAVLTAVSDNSAPGPHSSVVITAHSAIGRWAVPWQGLTAFHRGRRASQLASEFYGTHAITARLARNHPTPRP